MNYTLNYKVSAYYQNPKEKIQINFGSNTPDLIDLSAYPKSKNFFLIIFQNEFLFIHFIIIDLTNYFGYSPKNLVLSVSYPQLTADASSRWIIMPRTEFRFDANINGVEVYGIQGGNVQLGVKK